MELPYEWLKEIISLCIERIVVVDQKGIIVYIDSAYCEFLGIQSGEAIGQHVQDVIMNTRMHIVAKTGEKELEDLQPIMGSVMIANRYPIVIDGELVGALGTVMFPDPDNLRHFKNKMNNLMEELNFYKNKAVNELKSRYTFADLIGQSPLFKSSKFMGEKVAGSDSSILITGESGTGKELFAHAIHHSSMRSHFPFVPVNCASIPEALFESEFFGYSEGAFTGAVKGGKEGFFKMADKGTIFLDEIGEMPLSMQSKLLRALQEKEIRPVGGQKSITVDVRIIAATNRNLIQMIEDGLFRQDLYYRLNVINIEIAPLRKRKEDIGPIANSLLNRLERKFYRSGTTISEEAMEKLTSHNWPGNVRELENVLERAINVMGGNTIEVIHLPLYIVDREVTETYPSKTAIANAPIGAIVEPLKDVIERAEQKAIMNALKVTDGNKLEAARLLGIGKTKFYDKCKAFGI